MMFENYEINEDTLVLLPINEEITKVIEISGSFFINKKTKDIIDDSCKFFGSSYLGRYEGSKSLIGMNYKLPIIVEETRDIVFFPTSSPRHTDCSWISLNNVNNYTRSGKKTMVEFRSNINIEIDMSYGSFESQILRSTMLLMNLKKRKKFK